MGNEGPARVRWGLMLFAIVATGSVATVHLHGVVGAATIAAYLVGRAAQRDLDRGSRQ